MPTPTFSQPAFRINTSTLGGQQSARTIHFLVASALVLFLIVHVAMVYLAGFRVRMRTMITGRGTGNEASPQAAD